MMNRIMIAKALLAGLGGVALLACATAESSDVETAEVMAATVKPGAALQFSYEAPKDLAVGQYGVLSVSITDDYTSGSMTLKATPEPGLRFISETAETEFSLSGNDPHVWELDVTSNADGIYYVNIIAKVKLPDGRDTGRAFAARVDVGDITEAKMREGLKANGELSSDGTVVVMEASETIK